MFVLIFLARTAPRDLDVRFQVLLLDVISPQAGLAKSDDDDDSLRFLVLGPRASRYAFPFLFCLFLFSCPARVLLILVDFPVVPSVFRVLLVDVLDDDYASSVTILSSEDGSDFGWISGLWI